MQIDPTRSFENAAQGFTNAAKLTEELMSKLDHLWAILESECIGEGLTRIQPEYLANLKDLAEIPSVFHHAAAVFQEPIKAFRDVDS